MQQYSDIASRCRIKDAENLKPRCAAARAVRRLDFRGAALLQSPVRPISRLGPHRGDPAMTDIVIASAARTPVGAFNGGLAEPAGAQARRGRDRRGAAPRRGRAEGGVARSSWARSSPPAKARTRRGRRRSAPASRIEATAYGVNQLCGSGLRTVALGYQAIRNGDSEIVVAGGQESMSQAPHCIHLRNGVKMGDARAGRHDDQGRAVGRLQRLPHGQHRRERRAALADHPRAAGRVRRRLAGEGRGGAEGRPLQGRDRAGHDRDRGAATRSSTPTSIRSTAPRSRCCRSCARPSTRTARSPPATPRASMTAPPRSC